jgi:hypothetical protein
MDRLVHQTKAGRGQCAEVVEYQNPSHFLHLSASGLWQKKKDSQKRDCEPSGLVEPVFRVHLRLIASTIPRLVVLWKCRYLNAGDGVWEDGIMNP